jgi:zinc transporter ZupT
VTGASVFVASLVTALTTGLGALPFLAVRGDARRWIGLADGLAAGCMIGASVGLALEGAGRSLAGTAIGVVGGTVLLAMTRSLVARMPVTAIASQSRGIASRSLLVIAVMTIHSFAEGVGVGVAFGESRQLGLLIAAAIAVHNIPEGLAIALVLVPRGSSVWRAASWGVFTSAPQPLMAVPAFVFVGLFAGFLPVGLGFAAGAMLWLVASDLLPEAMTMTRARVVAPAVVGSAAAMLGLQLALV